MIRAIVIDDEWYNLEEISDLIEKTSFFYISGKYQNPILALEEVPLTEPQVAFIDIEIPEIDGITLAEKLLEINSSMIIVFITSYNQYAVQAFDLNAIDYILKPIKKERFYRMVEKIKNEIAFRAQFKLKTLKIKTFNHLNVTIGDLPVRWERAKAEELFAYLLMHHGSYIHKERIIENLWPDHEPEKALQILQTAVCKIRNLFSQIKNMVKLDYSGSRYCLVIESGECDYLEARSALSNYKTNDKNTFDAVENVSKLYGKGFLIEEGYIWSMEKDQEMREGFITALNEIINYYIEEGNSHKTKSALKQITRLQPFDENPNYMLIKMYIECGDNNAAFNHYHWLERVLKEEYDTVPSERIKAILNFDK
ncbi:response regulator [Alkaliphilus peptidifermentans]|uniref:Stage 0 sporulation protein A homolog n=1 Tax=Alkaliphilus peptidifermentans DSM 18978 TaxID=1120976 RepID=A0A1G5FEE1_9FIRM|nr:response regulator [Alkaliphilus peptidifermentans]SCY37511.1 Two-component response regulator, SAPR family, consists of REC, wHTH and BTAD domains [Alkaliphilus peptidifermentans DSM 18978]